MTETPNPCAALSRVMERLAGLLRPATAAGPFWVRGELSGAREHLTGFYFQLVETFEGQIIAKVSCQIFGSDLGRLRRRLAAEAPGMTLVDGLEVGLRCEVTFHPSSSGSGSDPAA